VRADIATRGGMTETHHALKAYTSRLRNELTQAISDLRNELKQDISELRNELKQDVSDLPHESKQDASALESCFIQSMFVQAIGLIRLTVTLVELLS
jgi:dsDNA-specific endonuclease/ATPase MutS2